MSSFRDFEQTGWQRAAEFYGDAFGSLTAQTAEAMLDAVSAAPGTRPKRRAPLVAAWRVSSPIWRPACRAGCGFRGARTG